MATIAEALARAMEYHRAGNLAQAEQIYREVLQADPTDVNALHMLGVLAHQGGQHEAAVPWIRQALAINPYSGLFHSNLAAVYVALGRWEEAVASYEQALRWRPNFRETHNHLGKVLKQLGRLAEAEASYRAALRLWPEDADALTNLGAALIDQGRVEEALASYHEALRLQPDHPEALNNLANAYKEQGRLDEAIACFRKATAANPELQAIHSNLLLALHYHAAYDPATTFAEHRRWAEQFGAEPAAHQPLHPVLRDPARRLRLGYVSPDFRENVMGHYSEAVIGAHDRGLFEVFCYANVPLADARTQRIKASADHWRSIVGLSDAPAADLIRQDQIDLLIDLSGHTAGNRLGVFARKPAPIQVTHFSYCDTTGLAAMDYRLVDAYCDPPGQTERFHTEKLVRLPEVQ